MAEIIKRRREGREGREGGGGELTPFGFGAWDPFRMMRDFWRWDPFVEMRDLWEPGRGYLPSFDVKETKDAFVYAADMPGVKEEDLDISLTEDRLTVSGKREEETREEGERLYAYERSFGSFSRAFRLPPGADQDHISAELKDGILRITVGKRPEVQPRRIALGAKHEAKA